MEVRIMAASETATNRHKDLQRKESCPPQKCRHCKEKIRGESREEI